MAINIHNLTVSNMTVGPLSGNGGGGGGGSTPSYLALASYFHNSDDGAVWVYDATDYTASPTKLSNPGGSGDRFGTSIAMTSTQLLIGAPRFDSPPTYNIGEVYVYDLTNLSASPTTLGPSGLAQSDSFGKGVQNGVAISSKYVVVGAIEDSSAGSNRGSAYVYDATNLSAAPTKIAPTDLTNSSNFGSSIAIQGDNIIISAPNIGTPGVTYAEGAVYVYDGTNLSASPTKLMPSQLEQLDTFGESIAATSNHLVIGAAGDDDSGSDAGAVYVYDINNLSSTPTKLTPSGIGANDNFGKRVAATDDYIVIGARADDDAGSDAGAAYVYDASNLSTSPTKLTPGSAGDQFGSSVAIKGDQLVVGAWKDAAGGTSRGAAYVYDPANLSASPTKITESGTSDNDRLSYTMAIG